MRLFFILLTFSLFLYGFVIADKYTVEYKPSSISFPFFNEESAARTFRFSVDGPSWVGVSPSSAKLRPGEGQEIFINILPSVEMPEFKEYDIVVKASADGFNKTYSQKFTLELVEAPDYTYVPWLIAALVIVLVGVMAMNLKFPLRMRILFAALIAIFCFIAFTVFYTLGTSGSFIDITTSLAEPKSDIGPFYVAVIVALMVVFTLLVFLINLQKK
jgi:hypothetical protein